MPISSRISSRSLVCLVAAGSLISSGAIHLDLYLTGYRSIETIGPLFLLQCAIAFVLAAALTFRRDRVLYTAAALFSLSTLGGYLLSRTDGLFGFHEVATDAGLTAALLDTLTFVFFGFLVATETTDAPGRSSSSRQTQMRLHTRLASSVVTMIGAGALAASLMSGVSEPTHGAAKVTPVPSDSKAVTIDITNFVFIPAHVTVTPRQRVFVRNDDTVVHTLTSAIKGAAGASFNTGDIQPNATKSFLAPTRSGTYQYFCSIHNFMTGVITVRP